MPKGWLFALVNFHGAVRVIRPNRLHTQKKPKNIQNKDKNGKQKQKDIKKHTLMLSILYQLSS